MSKKKILITGVAGFIGYHTCLRYLKMGYEVVGIDNLNDYYDVRLKKLRLEDLKQKNFTFIKCDFFDTKKLFSKLSKYKGKNQFSKIIHLGAQAGVRYSIENPYVYLQSNYLGALSLLEFAKNTKVPHFVLASTSSVYGLNSKQPLEEEDKTETQISTYAATKKACEVLAHTYSHLFNFKVTVLRFFTVYGPMGRPDMALFKFTKNILLGKPIQVYNHGQMARSFTYIDDVVEGVVGVDRQKSRYAIYNLGGSQSVKLMDFIKIIEENLKKKAKIRFLPLQAGDVPETVASTKKAEHELGYQGKTSIQEGIKNFIKWFLENKKLLLSLKEGKQ